MNHFLHALIDPTAVLMLFVIVWCLHALGWLPPPRVLMIVVVILGVVSFIAWAFLVFAT